VSNKSVVLLARDGLITMGCSGPAFISGATTDGWIAEVLTGTDLGASRGRPDFGVQVGGTVPDGFLYARLSSIADRLNEAVRARKIDDTLSIYYVGFRRQKLNKLAWPVVGRIAWHPPLSGYTLAMSKRRWGWQSGRSYLFGASGRSEDAARMSLRNRLLSTDLSSKEHAVSTLIDVLRAIPPTDETVSLDCLVTVVQRVSPHVHIKYEPYGIAQMTVASATRTTTLPAAFTPWIVTPGLLAAPQAIAGTGVTHQSGGFDFKVDGAGQVGDLMIMSSQQRRRP
jgi:hypothetical protein